MEAHTFDHRTRKEDLCEFEINLVYKASPRIAGATTQRSPSGGVRGEEGGSNNKQKHQNYVAYRQFLKLKAELT